MKKRIALLLIVCLCIGTPFTVLAARPDTPGPPAQVAAPVYVNLGDSIAYGMSAAPGQSYFERYARTLKPGMAFNLGQPGLVSDDLLDVLQDISGVQAAVASADIITISIGGNNLLRPVILAAFDAYGLDYDYDSMEEALADLYQAILAAEGEQAGTWNEKVNAILESENLSDALTAGFESFSDEWPAIMEFIHEANHDAVIKVLNLYNPVKPADNPAMHLIFENLLTAMNGILNLYQGEFAYQIVDVYTAFIENDEAVGFNLELNSLNLDPHPTTKGHQIIFRELMKLGNVRAFQPEKPYFSGNSVNPAIAETEDIAVAGADAGLSAAHEDEEGNSLSGFGFGQAVSGLGQEEPGALVEHVRRR